MKVKYVKITAGMLTGLAVASTAPYGVQAAGLTAGVASYTNNVVASASAPTAGVTSAVADVMLKGDETTTTDTDVASNEAETVKSAYADVAIAKVQDYVNVRAENNEDSEVLGKLYNNSAATVLETTDDGWYKISSGSVTGYVKSEYVVVGDDATVKSAGRRVATVNTETLKVRSEASTEAAVVTLVGQDQQLKVLDEQIPGWVKVETADGEGYISTEFASVADMYQYAEKPQVSEQKESSSGGSVTSYALQFLGNPYVWGGTSLTKGVDCSGFVMQVYAHYGISLPHSSSALRGVGRGVSYSEAQPGDIICYSGHVAIYLGGGKIVHASNPKDGIKVSTATYKKILAVRRVM